MTTSPSIILFGVFFVIFLIIKMIQNFKLKGRYKRKKIEILNTADLTSVLFNIALFTAGIANILVALGVQTVLLENDLIFTQEFINIIAGILLIWFSWRNVFCGGKM